MLALELLEKHGGYEKGDVLDEGEQSDSDGGMTDVESLSEINDSTPTSVSFLCAEAMMLTGSLEGDNQADRVDWTDAVMQCKTLSRFAALTEALTHRARPFLLKMAEDKERLTKAIEHWKGGSKTRNRKSKTSKKKKDKYNSSTEIWADITPTEHFIMAKVEGYPWWPARICTAKDSHIAVSLKELDRVLISFVGEHHLHVVREEDDMNPFTAEVIEDDLSKYSTDTMKKLKESIEMTRCILKGKGKWEEIELTEGHDEIIEEEKKSSS